MSGAPKPVIPTERMVQRGILKMAQRCFPSVLIHHSPNGAHLGGSGSAKFAQVGALKGDGMRVGFPDLICLWKGGVGFLEVKRIKLSKTSPEQTAMLELIASMGWPAAIVKSVDDAHATLKAWGAPCKGELQ